MGWLRSALAACFSPPRENSSRCSERPVAERVRVGDGAATSELKREPIESNLKPSFDSLVSAITRADKNALNALIAEGANLRAIDQNATTLLMVAAANSRESTQALQLLIDARVPLNARDRDGHTAVSWAAVMGCDRAMQLLLDAGADFNIRTNLGPLPLHFAAREGNAWIVEALLSRKGTAVDAMADSNGHTPLMLASMQGHIDVLNVLIERGADIDRTDRAGQTALMWAAAGGFVGAIKLLMGAGANAVVQNNDGFSPIHLAARHGHVQAVVSLLDLDASINQQSGGQRLTPLILAVSEGHMGMVIELIARGADLDAQDSHGMSAMNYAEILGDQPMGKLLIEAKAHRLRQEGKVELDEDIETTL